MLVLSRMKGEEVVIDGGRIRLTVIDIGGGKVRLGFIAPKSVRIDRAEVDAAKKNEKSDKNFRN